MERFKSVTSQRYRPTVALYTSLDCDAAVRTKLSHPTLPSLLHPYLSSSLILTHNVTPTPPFWLHAVSKLDQTLRSSHKTPTHLVDAYSQALESATTISDHDHLSTPLATFLCVWAAEHDILRSLTSIASNAKQPQDGTAAAATAAYAVSERLKETDHIGYATPSPLEPRVLIAVRQGSKQDEAALGPALEAVVAQYGEQRTFVIRLGTEEGDECPAAVAAAIVNVVRGELNAAIRDVVKYVDKLRKASRGTFRSWFGGSGAVPTRAVVETELGMMGKENGEMEEQEMSDGMSNGSIGRARRRVSFGSGGVRTPLFPVESLEARTKHLGDLYVLAGRYSEALEMYRMLQTEVRALTGAAIVHEAAACEMTALCLALVDGSKQGVGAGLEKAIQLYCRAGRQELAVRTTLRGMAFCVEAGYPDSAAGVILRSVDAVLPKRAFIVGAVAGLPASGSAFVEGALAVLYGACASAYGMLKKRRRASLYAFLGATRFAKLNLCKAAACVIRDVDDRALARRSVRDEVELILGKAENMEGNNTRAVGHFVHVMSSVGEHTDVEVQGAAIQGFLEAAGKGAKEVMRKRWDSGAAFPLVNGNLTEVCTHDSRNDKDEQWELLEDEVLEDMEFFSALSKREKNKPVPRRERRIEAVINDLRRKKEKGDSTDPGGSVEMKIKRIRELADGRKKRRRAESLLLRGAVVGERLSVLVHMHNPLQFPVFVNSLSAVVALDGKCYSSAQAKDVSALSDDSPVQLLPVDNITLVPSSHRRISVEVIANKAGTLQFLGLTWEFTVGMGGASPKDETLASPGYCIFERRGRRLNNTRRQRASEVPLYEKDESLIVTVAPSAPKLKAEIVCDGQDGDVSLLNSLTMRAGETRKARLVLTNEGPMPLESIVMRIGTPRTVYASVMPDKAPHETDGTLFAIGTDEDLVGEDDMIMSSRISLDLQPEKSKEIELWLKAAVPKLAFGYRGSSSGRKALGGKGEDRGEAMLPCEVRLAIAYSTSSVRVTRVSAQFRVQPSILVSPRFLREADESALGRNSDSDRHGILLGLEVEHGVQSVTENLAFHVTEISVTSRQGWKPMLLQAPSQCHESVTNEVVQSTTTLRINETATVFFFVVFDREFRSDGAVDATEEGSKPWRTFTANLSEGSANGKLLSPGEEEQTGLTALKMKEHKASTHFVMSAHYGSGSHVERKAAKGDLVYIGLGWRSSSRQHGEIHIPPIDPIRWMKRFSMSASQANAEGANVGASSIERHGPTTMDPTAEGLSLSPIHGNEDVQKWVSVDVRHPKEIQHDFYKRSTRTKYLSDKSVAAPYPAVVAVDVVVKNLSPYLLDVVFAAPASSGIADGDRGRYFVGDVAVSLRALPPGAQRYLSLAAVITQPGRFNLSKFTVLFQLCGYDSNQIREQVILQPSYLSVHSAVPLENEQNVTRSGALSPMTVITEKSSAAMEKSGEQLDDSEETLDEILRDGEKPGVENLSRNGMGRPPRPVYVDQQQSRITSVGNSRATVSKESTLIARSKTSLGIGSTSSAIMNSSSQIFTEQRKPFSRARSDNARIPHPSRSADDALWNASDTDESEG